MGKIKIVAFTPFHNQQSDFYYANIIDEGIINTVYNISLWEEFFIRENISQHITHEVSEKRVRAYCYCYV